jgi:hypothetical protein
MIGDGSKEAHMMMTELPMMLDHFSHRFERRRLNANPNQRPINRRLPASGHLWNSNS